MDFSFTPEQEAFRDAIREFNKRECTPEIARRLDENEEYPRQAFQRMAELGWLGLPFPEEYGGLGGTPVDIAIVVEELARGMVAAAQAFGAMIYVGGPIFQLGNEEQRRRFLPGMIRGEVHLAMGLTEPGSGSDAAALSTRATRKGDRFIINGTKMFSSRAHVADYILVAARTDPQAPKHRGISLFAVPGKAKGVTANPLKKLGIRAIGTCEVVLEDVEVPEENMLGKENEGWLSLLQSLSMERYYLAALCTGGIAAVLDLATPYSRERQQFDRPIGAFQVIQHKLADIYIDYQAARTLTYQAAWLAAQGKAGGGEGNAAKIFASEAYMRAANQGLQIMGGYGYMMEFAMQRHFRDAKLFEIGGGTSEVLRNVVGGQVYKSW